MIIKSNMWPPTKKELAWLLLNYTYPQIAEMYDTNHSVVQRLRDKYRIQILSRKDRRNLLNRTDIGLWSFDSNRDELPSVLQSSRYPKVRACYDKRMFFTTAIRALCTTIIGEIIPTFIDCHHVCGNPKCLNPRHAVLSIQQAHNALHQGKVRQLPDELVLRIANYFCDTRDACIEGELPMVKTITLPPKVWSDFLVNSMLVVDYLEMQIVREQKEELAMISRYVA